MSPHHMHLVPLPGYRTARGGDIRRTSPGAGQGSPRPGRHTGVFGRSSQLADNASWENSPHQGEDVLPGDGKAQSLRQWLSITGPAPPRTSSLVHLARQSPDLSSRGHEAKQAQLQAWRPSPQRPPGRTGSTVEEAMMPMEVSSSTLHPVQGGRLCKLRHRRGCAPPPRVAGLSGSWRVIMTRLAVSFT